tara:strand:- start:109 stop:309 length:201 start_codon:yes stop_codon:yes gene_type:complete
MDDQLIFRKHPFATPYLDTRRGDQVIRTELPPHLGGWLGYDKHFWLDVTDDDNAFIESWDNRRIYA